MNNLRHHLTTPQQNIYNETKFYSGTALGYIGGAIEFQMEGLTSEIIEKAINLLIDAAKSAHASISATLFLHRPAATAAQKPATPLPTTTISDCSDYSKRESKYALWCWWRNCAGVHPTFALNTTVRYCCV